MKRLLCLVLCLCLLGCTSETKYGECIGVQQEPDPKLVYEYDVGNMVWGILLSETIIVPALVLFDDLKCSIAKKEER